MTFKHHYGSCENKAQEPEIENYQTLMLGDSLMVSPNQRNRIIFSSFSGHSEMIRFCYQRFSIATSEENNMSHFYLDLAVLPYGKNHKKLYENSSAPQH
jgi:hypothetical protein